MHPEEKLISAATGTGTLDLLIQVNCCIIQTISGKQKVRPTHVSECFEAALLDESDSSCLPSIQQSDLQF